LFYVARAMTEAGDLEGALAAAEGIGKNDWRSHALSKVAAAMAEAGDETNFLTWTQNAFTQARQRGRNDVWSHIKIFLSVLGKLGVITPTWERIQAVEAVLTG